MRRHQVDLVIDQGLGDDDDVCGVGKNDDVDESLLFSSTRLPSSGWGRLHTKLLRALVMKNTLEEKDTSKNNDRVFQVFFDKLTGISPSLRTWVSPEACCL